MNRGVYCRTRVRQIAMLGGFIDRKADGEPDVQAIRLELRKIRNVTQAFALL